MLFVAIWVVWVVVGIMSIMGIVCSIPLTENSGCGQGVQDGCLTTLPWLTEGTTPHTLYPLSGLPAYTRRPLACLVVDDRHTTHTKLPPVQYKACVCLIQYPTIPVGIGGVIGSGWSITRAHYCALLSCPNLPM